MGTKQEAVKRSPLTGATLTAWRERMGYSQQDACNALGCAKSSWSRWESDKATVPPYIGLACSALAMGMTAYDEQKGA